jgi:hypothetical protein
MGCAGAGAVAAGYFLPECLMPPDAARNKRSAEESVGGGPGAPPPSRSRTERALARGARLHLLELLGLLLLPRRKGKIVLHSTGVTMHACMRRCRDNKRARPTSSISLASFFGAFKGLHPGGRVSTPRPPQNDTEGAPGRTSSCHPRGHSWERERARERESEGRLVFVRLVTQRPGGTPGEPTARRKAAAAPRGPCLIKKTRLRLQNCALFPYRF